jgi:hypothetical protein
MGIHLDFELRADLTDDGLERRHRVEISFVRFDDATIALLEAAGVDVESVQEEVAANIDRTVPLGLARGQKVTQVRLRRFVEPGQRSLGIYVDLALRSGPEGGAFHVARGDVALAQDFRPADSPLAFSTSPALFGLLGPDLRFRQAEETEPGSGQFRYPLREDPLDPESDTIGRIKGIRVGPAVNLGMSPPFSNQLVIDVHGEYTDALGDPDFHLNIIFSPEIDNGLVEWDIDVDIDLGLLATLLLVAAGIGLTLLFGPGLGLGSTLLVGTMLGVAVLKELIVEPLAAKIVEDRIGDDEGQASILDALPFRVPAALRRWDPFYNTEHQLVSLLDEVVVDNFGIAFAATSLTLGKEPEPIDHVVIRDEERSAQGTVSAFRYRVRDFVQVTGDLESNGPGLDRMAFARADPVGEPTLVSLTDEQIEERIGQNRLRAPITYTAERIHLVDNQIEQLLCLSRVERTEQERRLIDRFRATTKAQIAADEGDDIRADVTDDLTDSLGRPPTQTEINEAVDDILEAMVDDLQPDFIEDDLPGLLDTAIAEQLRFDLAPEELAQREKARVVTLDGKVIVTRHNADGTETTYYRDHPDGNPKDNLLSLPHYVPPYTPP